MRVLALALLVLFGRLADARQRRATIAECVAADGQVVSKLFDATALTVEGNAHFHANRYAKARGCYEWALTKDPVFETALLNVGLIHLMEERFDEAEKRIRSVIAQSPAYAFAHMSLGNVHASRQPPQSGQALAAYEAAYALDPTLDQLGAGLGESSVRVGQALSGEGRVAEAEAVLRKVSPVVSPAHFGVATELLVSSLRDHGQLPAAIVAAREGLKHTPTNVRLPTCLSCSRGHASL
jgi:tetratricopeptide (TPR) repeat protein